MKNFENSFNIKEDDSISKESKILNVQNYFDNSINISEIENKDFEQQKKFDLNEENNIENSLSCNFEDQSIQQLNKEINTKNNYKKKITKEDLNNIPLPIFSCIYCSNDCISFKHLSNEQLSSKYYIQTSIYDMKILDKLIQFKHIIDQYNKNSPLLDVIIKNSEYLKKFFKREDFINFYKTEKFKSFFSYNNLKIKNFFLQKIEKFIIRKKNKDLTNKKINGNKLIGKNISYNKLSFHNNNSNSIVNENCSNFLGKIKNSNNTFGTGTCQGTGSYSSMNNIISFSLNNNENNNILCLNNLNMMENIMEKIEKNEESENDEEGGEEFLNFFGNESQINNEINKNKISFEDKYYDIWNPDITYIKEENDEKEYENIMSNSNKDNNDNDINCMRNNNINLSGGEQEDNNSGKIFSERRIKEIKKIFNYSQSSCLKNKKINIKKSEKNKESFDLNQNNNENLNINNNKDNLITNDYLRNNLLKFKSFYLNKNKKNILNINNNNNRNLLNLFNNKKSINLDSKENLYHTKDLDININIKINKEKRKDNKKIQEKIKNMTINTINHEKNLLFLIKHPKTTSHSNKLNTKLMHINVISPKFTKKQFSSSKDRRNNKNKNKENVIIEKPREKVRYSTSRVKKFIDKENNYNYILSDFYENNIQIHNSRNYVIKRKEILGKNINNYNNFLKPNSLLINGGYLREKSGQSSCSNSQINLSNILHKNKDNEKLNELIKRIYKKNYKININDFILSNKKLKEKLNSQKLNINKINVPIINKRSVSVNRPMLEKKNLIKLKI